MNQESYIRNDRLLIINLYCYLQNKTNTIRDNKALY